MEQTVYIDVLLCLNLFVNYFILLGCTKFLGMGVRRYRLLLASSVGAIFSLYILLPTLNVFLSTVIEILMAAIIILIAFGFRNKANFIRTSVCFFSMNFSFAGLIFLLWKFFAPPGLIMNNGIVYFDISPFVLIISTVIAYILIRVFNIVTGKAKLKRDFYTLKIYVGEKFCKITAKLDTANSLIEPFSGLPVIVVKYDSVKDLFSDSEQNIFKYEDTFVKEKVGVSVGTKDSVANNSKVDLSLRLKLRCIPFNTISGNGILMAFRADKILLKQFDSKKESIVEAYVGVCSDEYLYEGTQALLNPDLICM